MEATFAPYKEKITIVRKYVSDVDEEDNITLDTFFRDEGKFIDNLFLKMDIEDMRGKHWKVLFISWSMDDKSVDQFVFIIYMMIKRL